MLSLLTQKTLMVELLEMQSLARLKKNFFSGNVSHFFSLYHHRHSSTLVNVGLVGIWCDYEQVLREGLGHTSPILSLGWCPSETRLVSTDQVLYFPHPIHPNPFHPVPSHLPCSNVPSNLLFLINFHYFTRNS